MLGLALTVAPLTLAGNSRYRPPSPEPPAFPPATFCPLHGCTPATPMRPGQPGKLPFPPMFFFRPFASCPAALLHDCLPACLPPGDLGNLDSLDPEAAAKLPGLMRLKRALYRWAGVRWWGNRRAAERWGGKEGMQDATI